MKDVQLLVLNKVNQLSGLFEIGEICIRSPHLALGYLSDDELTNQRFVQNPFSKTRNDNISGTRDEEISETRDDKIYKTGDFGYYNAEGNVIVHGSKRRTNQYPWIPDRASRRRIGPSKLPGR